MNEFEEAELGRRDEFEELRQVRNIPAPSRRKPEHPKGFEPGVRWDGASGEIITGPRADDLDEDSPIWAELIADWNIDPSKVEIVPPIEFRGWDGAIGGGETKRFKYYKARIRGRRAHVDQVDIDELIREIKRRKPLKANLKDTGNTVIDNAISRAMFVGLSDWQVGKGESDGSQGTVSRILDSLDRLVARIRHLAKTSQKVDVVYLVGLGDLIEGCMGHYSMQTFQIDLDRREQTRVVRRLILKYIDALLGLVDRIVCVAVPGNHGENRNGDGKAYTTFTDNDDLAVFESVAEILDANPERYSSVSVMLADGLSATVDMAGVLVGIAHMHQGRQGSWPQQKVENWWAGHALGRSHVADADILVTAHYHHFMCSESTGRTWFQVPAQDPGSAWFREGTGRHSPSGMLTFCVGLGYGARKWGDLAIL